MTDNIRPTHVSTMELALWLSLLKSYILPSSPLPLSSWSQLTSSTNHNAQFWSLTYCNPNSLRCCPIRRMISASIPVSFLCFCFLMASAEALLPFSFSSHPLLTCNRSPLVTGLSPFSRIAPFDCIVTLELDELEFRLQLGSEVLKEGCPISVSSESLALFNGGGVNPPSSSLSEEASAY